MSNSRSPDRPTRPAAGSSRPSRPAGVGAGRRRAQTRASGRFATVSSPSDSFLQRYGRLLLAGLAVIAVVAIGLFAWSSAAQPAFACSQEWTAPAATTPPAPGSSPRVGYIQPDLGKNHVAAGQKVTYALCPPASGNHYNQTNLGPLRPTLYGPDDPQIPQGWVHNLEHGGIVILYKCPGDACTDAGQNALRQLYTELPSSPVCNLPLTNQLAGMVVARFDQMAYPYVALLWGQILPLQSLDVEQIKAFWTQAERTNPEPECPRPTATPGPTQAGSPAPSATVTPSASVAPSGAVSPSSTAGSTTTPSASVAPSVSASPAPAASAGGASPNPS